MSKTIDLSISFEITDGNVRATVRNPDSFVGVYADDVDALVAADKALTAYLSMASVVTPSPEPESYPVYFSEATIRSMLDEAAENGFKVEIEYEDSEGHGTTRVVQPFSVSGNRDILTARDHLRGALRTFRIDRIKSIQRAS